MGDIMQKYKVGAYLRLKKEELLIQKLDIQNLKKF